MSKLPPGLYSICSGCERPTLGDKLTPVYRPPTRHPKYIRSTTDWLCPGCLRDERRGENEGEPNDRA